MPPTANASRDALVGRKTRSPGSQRAQERAAATESARALLPSAGAAVVSATRTWSRAPPDRRTPRHAPGRGARIVSRSEARRRPVALVDARAAAWRSRCRPRSRGSSPPATRPDDADDALWKFVVDDLSDHPFGAAPAAKTRALRRLARRSGGWCGCVQGTTGHNAPRVRLRISRPRERTFEASVSEGRSDPHHRAPGRVSLARPQVEVMTRGYVAAVLGLRRSVPVTRPRNATASAANLVASPRRYPDVSPQPQGL